MLVALQKEGSFWRYPEVTLQLPKSQVSTRPPHKGDWKKYIEFFWVTKWFAIARTSDFHSNMDKKSYLGACVEGYYTFLGSGIPTNLHLPLASWGALIQLIHKNGTSNINVSHVSLPEGVGRTPSTEFAKAAV